MSGPGISHFDHETTDEEMASELREPLPPPARRDRQADAAAAWRHHIDEQVRRSERQTMRALTSAVGQAMKEERAEHRAAIAELRGHIEMLEQRLAVLEEQRARFKVVDAA
jgi:hypothetical protein